MSRVISLFLSSFLIISCSNSLSDIKKTSDNKYLGISKKAKDRRMPINNRKYIDKAKVNILNSDLEDEEDEEDGEIIYKEDPRKLNQKIYREMLNEEIKKRRKIHNAKKKYLGKTFGEVKLVDLNDNSNYDEKSSSDLEKEINELKKLLQDTREEIGKVKCPYLDENDKTKNLDNNSKNYMNKNKILPNKISEKDISSNNCEEGFITPKNGSMSSKNCK